MFHAWSQIFAGNLTVAQEVKPCHGKHCPQWMKCFPRILCTPPVSAVYSWPDHQRHQREETWFYSQPDAAPYIESGVGRLQQGWRWSYCASDAVSPEIWVQWSCQLWGMRFCCSTDSAPYIESCVGRLQQEEKWFCCHADPVSPEMGVQWNFQLWWMWFCCHADSATYIESGGWRLQQGWTWWYCPTEIVSPETQIQWSCQLWWMSFYCVADAAPYIESGVGRLQQGWRWWHSASDSVSPETQIKWSCQLWGMWFYSNLGSAPCIESGVWRLQQGWRWGHCPTDEPAEPQRECHVAPQWGTSRFCKTLCWWSCTHFCISTGLYRRCHLPAGGSTTQQLKKTTQHFLLIWKRNTLSFENQHEYSCKYNDI